MVSADKNVEHDPIDAMGPPKEDEECDSSSVRKNATDSAEIAHHSKSVRADRLMPPCLFPMPHYPALAENMHSTNQSNVQDIHGIGGFLTTDSSSESNTLLNHLVAQNSMHNEKALPFSQESRLPMPFSPFIQKEIPRMNQSDNLDFTLYGGVPKEDSIHSNMPLYSPFVENFPHVEGNISNLTRAVPSCSSPAENSNAACQYATHNMAAFDHSVANLRTFQNYKADGTVECSEGGGRLQIARPLGEENSNMSEHLIGGYFINHTEIIPVSHHSTNSGEIVTTQNGIAGAVQADCSNKLNGSILAQVAVGKTARYKPNANIFNRISGNVGNIYPCSLGQQGTASLLNHNICGFSDYSSSQGTGFSRVAHSIDVRNSCKGRGKLARGKVRNVESGNVEIYPNAAPRQYSSNPIGLVEFSRSLKFAPQQSYGQLQNWNTQTNLNTLPQTSMPLQFDGTAGSTARNLASRGNLALGKRRNRESGNIETSPNAAPRPYTSNPIWLEESAKGLKFVPQQSYGQLQNWNGQTYVNILPQSSMSSQFGGATGNTAMNNGSGKLGRPLDSTPPPSPGKFGPSVTSGPIIPVARNPGLVHDSNIFSGASPNVRPCSRNFISNMDLLGPGPSPGPGMPIAEGSEIAKSFNGSDGPAIKRRTIGPPPATRWSQPRNTFIPSAVTSNQFSLQTIPCLPRQSKNQAPSIIHLKPPVPAVPPSHINPINSLTPVAHIKWKGPSGTPQLRGQNCPCCKRDLSCTPDGPLQLPCDPKVAVLPCGHVFHDHCLELITPQDQSHDPTCIPCALGEPLN